LILYLESLRIVHQNFSDVNLLLELFASDIDSSKSELILVFREGRSCLPYWESWTTRGSC